MALFLGAVLVLTGLTLPAQAATARSVTLSISPSAATAGTTFSATGRVTNSPAGSTIRIQRKSGTSWVTSKSVKTVSSYGSYRVSLTRPSTPGYYQYRAYAVPSGSRLAATSAAVRVTSLRKVTVTLGSSKSSITPGTEIVLSGKVYPAVAGTVATVQRFNGIKWSTLVTTTIESDRTFKRKLKPNATTTYRVVVPRTGLLATGYSPRVTVQVPTGPVAPVIGTSSLPNAVTETGYNQVLQVDGKAGTWAVTSGQLPPGLELDPVSGAITGTPTTGGTYPFTVTYSETSTLLSDSQALSIKVLVKPRITTTALPDATGYATYGPVTLTKSAQAGTWSITAGTLPTGITFDTATGVLSGKPTIKVAGDYPVTFRYTETAAPQLSASKQLTLHLNAAPAPVITTTSLPNATAYSDYAKTLAKTGNPGVWAITAGSLPDGLDFDTATGVLDGRPTVAGDFPLTFSFTETESALSTTKQLTLHVNPAPDPVISTTSLPDGLISAAYNVTLTVSTTPPGTWSIDSGALPAGITLNETTGKVSGTPTVSGTFPVTVRFTETESGTTATKALSLRVYTRPTVTTTGLPDAREDHSYSTALAYTGGSGSVQWNLSAGALPTGLTLSGAGVISGTGTVAGDYTFTVRVADLVTGASASKVLSIHVGPVAIGTVSVPDGDVGTPYSFQLTAEPGTFLLGGWSLTSGSLPPGIVLRVGGKLEGTPTLAGDYTFTVTYSTLAGSRSRTYTLHVVP